MKQSNVTAVRSTLLGGMGAGVLALGCSAEPIEASIEASVTSDQAALVGAVLPGLQVSDPNLLNEARAAFTRVAGMSDGLGPIFSERACGNCHQEGALGGSGPNTERRFGTFVDGIFDPLDELGGSLRQLFSVANFNNPNLPASSRGRCQSGNPTLCCVPVEQEPAEATVSNVGRISTALFGLGLIDSIPDSFFAGIAAAQPPPIRGVANRVVISLPNPGDPTQVLLGTRIGRFGWKAGVPSLLQFSADTFNSAMSITTQSCIQGTSVNAFALENAPNAPAGSFLDGCDDLAPRQTGPNPGGLTASQWAQVDRPVGKCNGGLTKVQNDVFLATVFMTALAPAPRDLSDADSIARGDPLFSSAGCSGCHVRTTFRTPADPPPIDIGNGSKFIRVPGSFAFNPYSDFLKHDMGTLGDMIGEAPPDDPEQGTGDTVAVTRRMRTAPLWGLRFRNRLLHDGRCSDVACAVGAHDGQGAASRNAFNALTPASQHDLTQFVRSL